MLTLIILKNYPQDLKVFKYALRIKYFFEPNIDTRLTILILDLEKKFPLDFFSC